MDKEYFRLFVVKRYKELHLESKALNDIVALGAEICGTTGAVLSLIDDTEEFFIAKKGTDIGGRPLQEGFCIDTLLQEKLVVISDLAKHKRFTNADVLTGLPDTRFYAGVTLVSPEGHNVGRLYTFDSKPKHLSKSQEYCLQMLSTQVITRLEESLKIQILSERLKDEERFKQSLVKSDVMLSAYFNSGNYARY
jgi:GAF domain-containing protein